MSEQEIWDVLGRDGQLMSEQEIWAVLGRDGQLMSEQETLLYPEVMMMMINENIIHFMQCTCLFMIGNATFRTKQ
jgi:hypothetical protein